MGFIDPVTAYIRWGTATIPAGQTTITVTHGASFTPNKIIQNRTDLPITINNVSNTTFDLSIPEQATDIDIEWMVGKNKNYVLQFDGVDDYVDAGNGTNLTSQAMSVSFWVKMSASQDNKGLVSKRMSGYTNSWQIIIRSAVHGGLRFSIWVGGVEKTASSNTDSLPVGTWANVVAVADKTSSFLYVDNVLVVSVPSGAIDAGTSPVNIGRYFSNSEAFNGIIDEVRIWNRALSASEVTALYNGNASRDGLVLEYLFQEASGTTATDTSGSGNQGTISGATYLETEVE